MTDHGRPSHRWPARSLLITTAAGCPVWRIGEQHSATLIERVLGALERPVPGGGLDVDPPLGLVAESSVGWFGNPGIEGHRPDGRDFAPQFRLRSSEATDIGRRSCSPTMPPSCR